MREIGPLMDLQQVSAYDSGQDWLLAVDAQTRFDAQYDPALNRLVLSGVIAPVPPQSRLAIYEILLQYNAAWIETGGVRMALDQRTSDIVMLLDLPAADLHAGLLAQVLANMAGVQTAWRQILGDLASPQRD